MSNEKLLPCPFCSGEAEIKEENPWHYVQCSTCHCVPYLSIKEGDAITKWNTRHEPKREFVVNQMPSRSNQSRQGDDIPECSKSIDGVIYPVDCIYPDFNQAPYTEFGDFKSVQVKFLNNTGKPIFVEQGENTVSIVVNQAEGD